MSGLMSYLCRTSKKNPISRFPAPNMTRTITPNLDFRKICCQPWGMEWMEVPTKFEVDINPLSTLIDQIGTSGFDIGLLHYVNLVSCEPVSEVAGYIVDKHGVPEAAGWCGIRGDISTRVSTYTSNSYKDDPVLAQLPTDYTGDSFLVSSIIHPDDMAQSYRNTFFEVPGHQTEIAVLKRDRIGWKLAKLYLEDIVDDAATILQIGKVGALIFAIGKRHALYSDDSLRGEARPQAEERVQQLLARRFPQLTPREKEVCALSILGKTTQSIADQLSISPTTVITYRQRAYDRLGVSNTSAMVVELI